MNLKNKKGVSIMIGYILLITAAVVMGAIVYNWMTTYVPLDIGSCPEDVSIFVKNYSCDQTGAKQLNITLKNNGKFDIGGYFIYASVDSSKDIATLNLSSYLHQGGIAVGSAILFVPRSDNPLKPGDEFISVYNLTDWTQGGIKFIEIIPSRYQESNNRKEFVSCGNAKVKEVLTCTANQNENQKYN